jgi:multicomponent Na+:H+ antiporter subunit E
MLHVFSLLFALCSLWLALSGQFEPLLLVLGLLSCVFVLIVALRMDVVDEEGQMYGHLLLHRVPSYWLWLLWEIIKSNLDVTRRILDPKMPISPSIAPLPASQRSELGRVIYANSITLTPGTITISLDATDVLVHSLTLTAEQNLVNGEMGQRVNELEEASS